MNRRSGQNKSLADEIAGILNTAPSNFDPEDDAVDGTSAQIQEADEEEEEVEDDGVLSKFRKANVDILADLDEKYAGKKTSRRSLRSSESEVDSEVESNENEGSGGEQESEEDSEDEESEDEDSEAADEYDVDIVQNNEEDADDANFKHISDNVTNQVKKGISVRNQMSMWENLLEARIQLQKCLLNANQMPQTDAFVEMKKNADQQFSTKLTETKNTLCGALDKLLLLQKMLLKQFPETKTLGQQSKEKEEDDEEIPSDTDAESANEEEEESPKKKKMKLEEYESEISKHHKDYKDYRNSVIKKWNDKTRVVLKGNVNSHSVLDQIEYNLSNKDKLVKKTQVKRSQYKILGQETDQAEEHNPEIFDDDDFYHQLLRELIEVKSADVTDPVQLGRQWIQLQNMRSKMKRKIDTKATKGRKIRYAVHNKLVNFMAPIDENLWTDEAKTELYNSLFGKNRPLFSL